MISRISLESVTVSAKKLDLILTIFPIVLMSNINEIYIGYPLFKSYQGTFLRQFSNGLPK